MATVNHMYNLTDAVADAEKSLYSSLYQVPHILQVTSQQSATIQNASVMNGSYMPLAALKAQRQKGLDDFHARIRRQAEVEQHWRAKSGNFDRLTR